jgi:hypothetical protein
VLAVAPSFGVDPRAMDECPRNLDAGRSQHRSKVAELEHQKIGRSLLCVGDSDVGETACEVVPEVIRTHVASVGQAYGEAVIILARVAEQATNEGALVDELGFPAVREILGRVELVRPRTPGRAE